MKTLCLPWLMALAVLTGCATNSPRTAPVELMLPDSATPVDKVHLRHNTSFSALDRRHVVLWVNNRTPYLLRLAHPCGDPRFTETLALSNTGDYLRARFDSVLVDGSRCPVELIWVVLPDDVKWMRAQLRG